MAYHPNEFMFKKKTPVWGGGIEDERERKREREREIDRERIH
jgi:hypothetical protein